MVRRPSYAALRAFEALVRCGSIHKAADDIHVSPGAVSQQVRQLEAAMEISLFDRSGRSMTPTAVAKDLAAEITSAFRKIDDALSVASASDRTVQLRIATLPSIATRFVLPRLSQFKKRAPDVQLSFTYIHRLEDIKNWDTDVLICAVDSKFKGEGTARELFSGRVCPFASKGFIDTHGLFKSDDEFTNSNLLHDFSTLGWETWLKEQNSSYSKPLGGDIFEDFELLIHALLADQGIALCPPPLVSNEVSSGQLVPISDRSALQNRRYIVVIPENAINEAMLFADWLIESTQGL